MADVAATPGKQRPVYTNIVEKKPGGCYFSNLAANA